MEANMSVPHPGNQPMAPRNEGNEPVLALRREMNRLFDDVFSGFGLPIFTGAPMMAGGPFGRLPASLPVPRVDVSETESEFVLTAELPGMDEKDVEITLTDDLLTIRGEKKVVREDTEKKRDYHLMERSYGVFLRTLRLPFRVESSQVQAGFENGVLTVTIPKPAEVREKMHRIEVKKRQGTTTQNGPESHAASSPEPAPVSH
ncbi:MAG TPA: Hsp20/alpha crystallin family protein [Stellaceae bacterium]|nr:Hsp20/alpha crystallin family protein [Stellaceae bacterium]